MPKCLISYELRNTIHTIEFEFYNTVYWRKGFWEKSFWAKHRFIYLFFGVEWVGGVFYGMFCCWIETREITDNIWQNQSSWRTKKKFGKYYWDEELWTDFVYQSDWPLDSDWAASLFFRCCCRWNSMACCWRLWSNAAECSWALRRNSSTLPGVACSKWNPAGPAPELFPNPDDGPRSSPNRPEDGKSPGKLRAPMGLGFTGQHGHKPEKPWESQSIDNQFCNFNIVKLSCVCYTTHLINHSRYIYIYFV